MLVIVRIMVNKSIITPKCSSVKYGTVDNFEAFN